MQTTRTLVMEGDTKVGSASTASAMSWMRSPPAHPEIPLLRPRGRLDLPGQGPGLHFKLLPESKIKDKTALGIKVNKEGKPDVDLYFDKATGSLKRRRSATTTMRVIAC